MLGLAISIVMHSLDLTRYRRIRIRVLNLSEALTLLYLIGGLTIVADKFLRRRLARVGGV